MKILTVFLTIIFILVGLSCSNFNNEEECTTKTIINPNGDSEMALLMREMFDDGMRMKQQIENGKTPEVVKKFEKIHTAEGTEPEKVQSEKFKIFADSYLSTLEALRKAPSFEGSQIFHGMVESCMNCHKAMCPGPMVRIKKLYLEN